MYCLNNVNYYKPHVNCTYSFFKYLNVHVHLHSSRNMDAVPQILQVSLDCACSTTCSQNKHHLKDSFPFFLLLQAPSAIWTATRTSHRTTSACRATRPEPRTRRIQQKGKAAARRCTRRCTTKVRGRRLPDEWTDLQSIRGKKELIFSVQKSTECPWNERDSKYKGAVNSSYKSLTGI